MRLFKGFGRAAKETQPTAAPVAVTDYTPHLDQIDDAENGSAKAAAIISLFAAMKKNGHDFSSVLYQKPQTELREAILKTTPFLTMGQNKDSKGYFAPSNDSSTLIYTENAHQAQNAWIESLKRVNRFAMSAVINKHCSRDREIA